VLALVCMSGCLSVIPPAVETDVLVDERACTGTPPEGEESECIGITATECSCNNDGTMIAVNKAFVASIEERRLEGNAVCGDQISRSETCCANGAACIDGRCELVGPRGRSLESDCINPIDTAPE
jgi:hypothetical protein